MDEQYVLDGFAFSSREEYNIALREKKNVNSLRNRMNMNEKDSVLLIYRKLATKKLFISPIGIAFMQELRQRLIEEFHVEETELPLITVRNQNTIAAERTKNFTNEQLMKENIKKTHTITTLRIVLVGCIVIIVAIFILSNRTGNFGYLNAENRILNKYSSWEENLKKREAVIHEKEEKLGIEDDDSITEETK